MPLDQIDYERKRDSRINEMRMSFGDHLEDLRRRLILALLGPLVSSVLGLVYGKQIVGWLVKPLAQVQHFFDLPPQTYNLAVTTGFSVYMKVGLMVGLIIASPWVVYQLWKFIESGLYDHEKRAMYWVAPFSGGMTVLGVLFLYYILLPITLSFLIYFTLSYPALNTQESKPGGVMGMVLGAYDDTDEAPPDSSEAEDPDETPVKTLGAIQVRVLEQDPPNPADEQVWIRHPEGQWRYHYKGQTYTMSSELGHASGRSMVAPMIEIGQYISFVTMMGIAVVVSFQLPVVMMIVGWTGLVDPSWLSKYRRYCIFVCFVLGALLTPADPVSMFALALPLWGLFELGLLVMRTGYRDRTEPADAGEA